MTPDQIAAELAAVTSSIETALDDEHADRQYVLETVAGRLDSVRERIGRDGPPAGFVLRADGPHSDGYTAEIATVFADAARVLNYATGPHADTGLTEPATAYAVCGELAARTYRLGQLASLVMAFLDRERAAGRLSDDAGRSPLPLIIEQARSNAAAATRHASALSAAFTGLHNILSGLARR